MHGHYIGNRVANMVGDIGDEVTNIGVKFQIQDTGDKVPNSLESESK